jgi:hypothetical protein
VRIGLPDAVQRATGQPFKPQCADLCEQQFPKPHRQLVCRYFKGANPLVACVTPSDGAMAGVRLRCAMGFKKPRTSREFPSGPVLGYGKVWRSPGEFKCKSTLNGIECWSLASSHGFSINQDQRLTY